MLLEAIYHRPYSEYAFPLDDHTLVLRIRTKKNDVMSVLLYYREKFDPSIKGSLLMNKVASDSLFDYFEARIDGGLKRFKYMFYLEGRYEAKWYNADGFYSGKPDWGYFNYSNLSKNDALDAPVWFKKAILYQVFPDRFNHPIHSRPSSKEYKCWAEGNANKYCHFGGTLEGMKERLQHLVNLGVDALYINPVFKSNSYHRYDTIDYLTIDPALGNMEEFKGFIQECHQKRIRVILDAVLNHTGSDFFAFKDIQIHGENSRYKDWYHLENTPLKTYPKPNYQCFAFFGGMPKLNTSNEETAQYLLGAITYWINELKVDGLRLDAADELERSFIRRVREHVKKINPEVVIIGEVWDEASSYMQGDQFDSVSNYPLLSLITDLLAHGWMSAADFRHKWDRLRMSYSENAVQQLVNMVGTHDTPRFLTQCRNNKRSFLAGIVLQFTLPGVPLVYYGDEVGMTGGGDPDCRMPMVWDPEKWDGEILHLYKFLIKLRKNHFSLTVGNYKAVEVGGSKNVFAFRRENGMESISVVLNTSGRKTKCFIEWDGSAKSIMDVYTGQVIELKNLKTELHLNPYEWKIYIEIKA
ncbi:MAG: glycoside hydrolase family 13 protein [Clostridia bacterium]|nr:glycoside hydrolase family 13 protein [Clostridia bacterium]